MPVLAVVAFAALLSSAPATTCQGDTTVELNACAAAALKAEEATLARYVEAARERLAQSVKDAGDTDLGPAAALKGFDAAEGGWRAYRDAECGAVYAYWSGGTIRTLQAIDCRIYQARLRTHAVWRHWLTYADSTPPVLPEPALPKGE